MKRENQKKAIFCGVFFVVLCGFWLADVLCKDRIYSDWEKRMLAQRPEFTVSSLMEGTYGTSYEEWLTDQFPGRDRWVSVKTRCEILLGKKEIQGIYLGKEGYLFAESTQTADWDKLEQQMQERFGKEAVSRIHAPHAGTVLQEYLPQGIRFFSAEDDVLKNLEAHKNEYIYFKTDHHWTMLGAYYAYEAWARQRGMKPLELELMDRVVLREDFLGTHYGKIHYTAGEDQMEFYDPGISCSAVYDLGTSTVSGLYQPQHLDGEDAYRYFLDGNHGLVQITTEQTGGHLAVLKDSFANNLVPFLTAHYGKITVIDPRYFRMDIGEWLSEQDVTEVLIVAQDTTKVTYE
ncbi:MAG: hypothetical protein IKV59_10695 [Lachnospiraceae bacterium]|nr:hypothetical protein [Lachnospiraceae bacterium]